MVPWKMGSWKMCGLSPNGLVSTSMIMGGRVYDFVIIICLFEFVGLIVLSKDFQKKRIKRAFSSSTCFEILIIDTWFASFPQTGWLAATISIHFILETV